MYTGFDRSKTQKNMSPAVSTTAFMYIDFWSTRFAGLKDNLSRKFRNSEKKHNTKQSRNQNTNNVNNVNVLKNKCETR